MAGADGDTAIPFFDFVGVENGRVADEVGIAEMPWRPETANSSGRMHGGAVMAAVNAAMVKLVRELTGGVPAALVQFAISFVASGTEDVTATAELVRSGRSMIFVTGRVTQSESGRVIATASAVFQRRPSKAEVQAATS
jgi:uncharacterized protein (TIGR00369 family)